MEIASQAYNAGSIPVARSRNRNGNENSLPFFVSAGSQDPKRQAALAQNDSHSLPEFFTFAVFAPRLRPALPSIQTHGRMIGQRRPS